MLDTGGQEEYSAMREQYMRTGEGFMLVYSVTSRSNFEDIATYQQQILRTKDKDYSPMIIVGNNCSQESERQVSTKEGQDFARQFGCKFIETDARGRVNVDNAFHDLVREIRRYNKEMMSYSAFPKPMIVAPSRNGGSRRRRKAWWKTTTGQSALDRIEEG